MRPIQLRVISLILTGLIVLQSGWGLTNDADTMFLFTNARMWIRFTQDTTNYFEPELFITNNGDYTRFDYRIYYIPYQELVWRDVVKIKETKKIKKNLKYYILYFAFAGVGLYGGWKIRGKYEGIRSK